MAWIEQRPANNSDPRDLASWSSGFRRVYDSRRCGSVTCPCSTEQCGEGALPLHLFTASQDQVDRTLQLPARSRCLRSSLAAGRSWSSRWVARASSTYASTPGDRLTIAVPAQGWQCGWMLAIPQVCSFQSRPIRQRTPRPTRSGGVVVSPGGLPCLPAALSSHGSGRGAAPVNGTRFRSTAYLPLGRREGWARASGAIREKVRCRPRIRR